MCEKEIISKLKTLKYSKIKIFALQSWAYKKREGKIEIFCKNHQSWSNSFKNSLNDDNFHWLQRKILSSKNDTDFRMIDSLISIKTSLENCFYKSWYTHSISSHRKKKLNQVD
jgi:hypothetical protein